jgi:hypothetical protein
MSAAVDAQVQPEQLIAAMNRSRHWKVLGAVGGLILALVVLFGATMAMYSDEPNMDPPPRVPTSLTP